MHYSYQGMQAQEGNPPYGLGDACLQLYDLHNFEVLWEKAEDTKALLAWSPERIVLSFRGTASWANVLVDLRFWLKGGFLSFVASTSEMSRR